MEPVEATVVRFDTADGVSLEADLIEPPGAQSAAVVCHPHPLMGGTRHDMVAATISEAFVSGGYTVLRFDFRGAGGSEGRHGEGVDEGLDITAALETVSARSGADSVLLAGYSFGADVALSVAHPLVQRWIGVAAVLRVFETFAAASDPRPTDLFAATHDQFKSSAALVADTSEWASTSVHSISGTDHFFTGAHTRLAAAVSECLGPAAVQGDGP